MRKLIPIIATVAILSGCQLMAALAPPFHMPHPLSYYGVPTFSSIAEANAWIYSNVEYHAQNYWETPDQTLVSRRGDCNDMALLLLYIAKDQFDTDGLLLGYKMTTFSGHVLGKVQTDWYDPSMNQVYSNPPSRTPTIQLTTQEALDLAARFHQLYL